MSAPAAMDFQAQSAKVSTPAWQQVYKKLELNEISGITSYQVNGNLFIVIPLEEEE